MVTNKHSVNNLAKICELKGIRDIVFSPGSRNAALVIAFNQIKSFNTYVVPDERVAGFMALGMSISSGRPTVICCTSGSAVLNYAPAIVEAYYQRIPLLILTADRPQQWIDQGIGQSMRQNNVYNNYIKESFTLIQEAQSTQQLDYNDRLVNLAINASISGVAGPVHINIPFEEPLYGVADHPSDDKVKIIDEPNISSALNLDQHESLLQQWQNYNRKIIIVGQLKHGHQLTGMLKALSESGQIVLLSETCSNLPFNDHIACIDRVISDIRPTDSNYIPDLVVTLGGPVISKKIKYLLQQAEGFEHWDVTPGHPRDTFSKLTKHLPIDGKAFLSAIINTNSDNQLTFQQQWQKKNIFTRNRHHEFLNKAEYSDLKVFEVLLKAMPGNVVIHAANSTPVRYLQLFERDESHIHLANRGVSGIDGCSSTAIGYSLKSDKMNILITGDIAFFYDSNAFWHHHLPANLKIILINNGGGGIFRIIEGPQSTPYLEEFFEASHTTKAEPLCYMHNMKYLQADSLDSLQACLVDFFKEENVTPIVLEIITPAQTNATMLKEYFKYLCDQ